MDKGHFALCNIVCSDQPSTIEVHYVLAIGMCFYQLITPRCWAQYLIYELLLDIQSTVTSPWNKMNVSL